MSNVLCLSFFLRGVACSSFCGYGCVDPFCRGASQVAVGADDLL